MEKKIITLRIEVDTRDSSCKNYILDEVKQAFDKVEDIKKQSFNTYYGSKCTMNIENQ